MSHESLEDVVRRAVKEWALGPEWQSQLTAWPLSAVGSDNNPDDWPHDPILARRKGRAVTVWNDRVNWCATVICSPTGKSVTVVVPKGATVVEATP